MALLDCSQEGTGDSGWNVPLCPRVTIESAVLSRSVIIHAGICPEPSLLLTRYPECYVLESCGVPGFEGAPGVPGACLSCGTVFITIACMYVCIVLYTWRIEDNMQELGTPGKFRSLSCVARTLALSFLATSVRINLKHVINVSTGGCVCEIVKCSKLWDPPDPHVTSRTC